MSPPLIHKVRAHTNPAKLTVIDAPPGTSCPVIASMKGADFVLLVTEPTPFGLHDLKLAVGAVGILGIPCGLVINRADIGDNQVKEYAEKNRVPVLMEIPFDRRIAETYSRGQLLVEVMPEWKENFLGLYRKIEGYSKEKGLAFLEHIPFDPIFTKAMVQGQTLSEYDSHAGVLAAVKGIWKGVRGALEL